MNSFRKKIWAVVSLLGFGSLLAGCDNPWVCMYMAPEGEWTEGPAVVVPMYGVPPADFPSEENPEDESEKSEESEKPDSTEALYSTNKEDYGIPEE